MTPEPRPVNEEPREDVPSSAPEDGSSEVTHWRLFVAVEIPVLVRMALEPALSDVLVAQRQHLRITPAESWHVTLAFLGGLHPSWSDVIEDALARVAVEHHAFDVRFGRAGRFGRGVLFLGFDDDSFAAITALGESVRSELHHVGLPFDSKPLHPHVTLARQRDRRGTGVSRSRLQEVNDVLDDPTVADELGWRVRNLALVRSHLESDGARHEPLMRLPLREAD